MTTAVREPIDLRLAAGTAVGWVLLALCVGRSACTVTGVTVVVFGTGGCAFLASRHGSRGASVVAVAGFCGALVLGPFAGRLVHARAGPLMRLAAVRSAVSLSLTAAGDPRPLAAKGVGGPVRIALDTNVRSVTVAGRTMSVSGHVLVIAQSAGWLDLLPGQGIRVDGQLEQSLDDPIGATLFTVQRPELVGRPPWWQRLAGRVRDSLRVASAGLPDGPRGLLPGLVDGDTTGLNPALAARFRVAGLTHLVAVSGAKATYGYGLPSGSRPRQGGRVATRRRGSQVPH